MKNFSQSLFQSSLLKNAFFDAFKKLSPHIQWRNPVMFVVYLGSLLTTGLLLQALNGQGEAPINFIFVITLWLWFTVLFANFAEALAEGRSRAQAAFLRGTKKDIMAKKLHEPHYGATYDTVTAASLRKDD